MTLLHPWPAEAKKKHGSKGKKAASTSTRRSQPKPVSLEQRLLALAARPPIRRRSEFAVTVAKAGAQTPLISVNGSEPLTLASTTKLFTSSAALDRLGPDYRFRTRIYLDGDPDIEGVLSAPLVVVGGGDPAISGRLYDDDPMAVFRPWAEAVRHRGVTTLQGGILLDTAFFDSQQVHDDWPAAQEQAWYQAPVSALSYNDNVVAIRATGAVRPGSPAILGFYPAGPPFMSLIGRVLTAPHGYGSVGLRRPSGSRTVLANGVVGRNQTWAGVVTVPDPALYLGQAFSQVLRETGVRVAGPMKVRLERASEAPGKTLIHIHETPILPVLAVCNKRSHSLFAEQILKTLGAEKRGKGSWENGLLEVKAFLTSLGLDARRYQLADGSGRSPNNRATAEDYVAFLQALATKWEKFSAFEPTLAITGDPNGSLRKRMLGAATYYKVYAKTGNLAGVSTLCGYITAQSGQRYVFAILINGGVSEGAGHTFQDRFLTELAKFG